MLSSSLFSVPQVFPKTAVIILLVFILTEYIQRNKRHALQIEGVGYRALRWAIYSGIVLVILLFGGGSQNFIYFQF
jgi:hypothetical protein